MSVDFDGEYQKLNPAQKRAVDAIDGPVIVVAGPGSGKTQLLGMRVANILKQTDTQPGNILCLTFTEAAASNLRSRLFSLIGTIAHRVEIYTFHSFGTHIIQSYPEYFYDKPLVTPINELKQYETFQMLLSYLHHNNPLSKKIGNSFLHIQTIMSTISWFKQAGLQPEELDLIALKSQAYFNHINKHLTLAFKSTPSAKQISIYKNLLAQIIKFAKDYPSPVADASAQELVLAIDNIESNSRYAKSITQWRDKWLVKTRSSSWQYIDQQRNNFLVEVAKIYQDYETELAKQGLYSYDDMILRTNTALETNEELKFILQERYQYILVDEYQDTNGAQDKLLSLLADNMVNEGRPNLMVVGDDDQAIYRFQGAESSIMYDFIKHYKTTEIIVLSESYRSGQGLLDLAQHIISNANDRLESVDGTITKNLVSKIGSKATIITQVVTETEAEYYLQIAKQIKELIKIGNKPSSIAVLAPKHRFLVALVPYLMTDNIPINYERREQVLFQPRIIEVLNLVDLVWALAHGHTQNYEALLPKILGSPYFNLPIDEWWQLAINAQNHRQGWLEAIKHSKNQLLNNFCAASKKIAIESPNQPFELTLAYLTGNKSIRLDNDKNFDLPWRDFYFSEASVLANPAEYLQFMNQYETLKLAFNDWLGDSSSLVTIDNFRNFINLYLTSKLSLLDESPYMTARDAVNLLTVYKAKGLEWDNVILLNCQNDVWGPKTRNQNLSFRLPSILKWIEPARDNSNDLIRLFYVAVTRARKHLFLTSFNLNSKSKPTEKLEWLSDNPYLPLPRQLKPITPTIMANSFATRWQNQFMLPKQDLNLLLQPLLPNYKLSATHLNEFLAVNKGGPRYFLFKYLLQVPEILNPNAMFGSAIHKTLEYIHKQYSSSQNIPDNSQILKFFNDKLMYYPLTRTEQKYFKKRGKDDLTIWLAANQSEFSDSDISEFNFNKENIVIGEARLTGKIDVLKKVDDKNITVIDYKTSSPIYSWQSNNVKDSINSHAYQRQLMFYKFLVDNSNNFGNKYKVSQGEVKFITPDNQGDTISLKYNYQTAELNRMNNLINAVWQKIITLSFPDTDNYPDTLTGIRQFEADLLDNAI